jgi:hypothetical protein
MRQEAETVGTNQGRYRVDPRHFADGPEPPTNRSDDFDENVSLRDTTAQRALLDRAVLRIGNPAELARQLRVTDSHVSRLRKGHAGVSIVLALRFADVLDEDGVALLRTVGHADAAASIDRLRKGSPERPRTVLEDKIDRLSGDDRRMLASLVDRLLVNTTGPTRLPAPDPQTRSRR